MKTANEVGWLRLQSSFSFALRTDIRFGPGVADSLGETARTLGDRALIVTDPGIAEAGLLDKAESLLTQAGLEPVVYAEVEPNPRMATVDAIAQIAADRSVDVLVGIGGGSPLDAAKAAAPVITHGGKALDYEGLEAFPGPCMPVLAVPTTAGTGAEVTAWGVVTDPARRLKTFIGSYAYGAPRAALVDPLLAVSLPPALTAGTGMDALTHAIEAYTARPANPVSDALCLYAIQLIAGHIEQAVRDGRDLKARCGMALGSLIAGIGMGNSDCAGVHAMAEAVGGAFDVPHGAANAVFLPHVLMFNAPAVPERTVRVGLAMGLEVDGLRPVDAARVIADALLSLSSRLGLPTLRQLGVGEDDLPLLVSLSMMSACTPDNPVVMDENDFLQLYREAYGVCGD